MVYSFPTITILLQWPAITAYGRHHLGLQRLADPMASARVRGGSRDTGLAPAAAALPEVCSGADRTVRTASLCQRLRDSIRYQFLPLS